MTDSEVLLPEKLDNLGSSLHLFAMQLYRALSFGEVLKLIRVEKNLQLQDLAKNSKIDKSVLSKLESGKTDITKHYAMKIGDAFDIPFEYLLVFAMNPENLSERQKTQYFQTIKITCNEYIFRQRQQDSEQTEKETFVN